MIEFLKKKFADFFRKNRFCTLSISYDFVWRTKDWNMISLSNNCGILCKDLKKNNFCLCLVDNHNKVFSPNLIDQQWAIHPYRVTINIKHPNSNPRKLFSVFLYIWVIHIWFHCTGVSQISCLFCNYFIRINQIACFTFTFEISRILIILMWI